VSVNGVYLNDKLPDANLIYKRYRMVEEILFNKRKKKKINFSLDVNKKTVKSIEQKFSKFMKIRNSNENSNNLKIPKIENKSKTIIEKNNNNGFHSIKSLTYLKSNRLNSNIKFQLMKRSSNNFFNKNNIQENSKLNKNNNKIRIIKLKHIPNELNNQNAEKETDKIAENDIDLINMENDKRYKNIDNVENNNELTIFNDMIKKKIYSLSKRNKKINNHNSMRLIKSKYKLFQNKILINSL